VASQLPVLTAPCRWPLDYLTPPGPGRRQHEDRQLAEPRSRQEVAREARARPVRPEGQPQPDGPATVARTPAAAVTHFHGEFKTQQLDLYTDGNRWETADSTRREQTVPKKGDIPIQLPTGQDLVDSAEDNNPSRADRIRSKLYEQSEDALDILEKNANIGEEIFARPPTGSYEGTPTPQPHIYETHPAGIDAGTAATAIFTLGLVIDRAAHRTVEYYEKHVKGDNHAGN
jgi:hypothetical protein